MKFPKLLFFSLIIAGCNSTSSNEIKDNRPATQLSFIKKFHIADSLFSSETNKIKKREVYDKQEAELIKFMTDSVPAEVKEWHAFIYKIDVDNSPSDNIEITLLIPQNRLLDKDDKYPQYGNIVLFANESLSDSSSVTTSLKELSKGDKVLVTGSFEKNEDGNVKLRSNMDDVSNTGLIFTNPIINFKIKSIVKQGE